MCKLRREKLVQLQKSEDRRQTKDFINEKPMPTPSPKGEF
jgi:hypothetical protein